MLETTRGIVLHYNRFGDDKAIVEIFTLAHGSLSFMVRDSRQRGRSLQATLLRPLNIVELTMDYRPNLQMQRIKELHLAVCYSTLSFDPVKETVALLLSEFLHNAVRKEIQNPDLYHYILYSLQWFDAASRGIANFHLAFLIRLTYYLGFWPCTEADAGLPYFDLQGGIMTFTPPLHGFFLRGEEAALVPLMLRMNLRNMHRFRLSRDQRNRILDIITLYYRLHVPEFRDLRSLAILREISNPA